MHKPLYLETGNETLVFRSCFQSKLPLMLKGPTGCGKSQFVEAMAFELDVPLIKVACNEDTNAADLLGRYILKGGETIWVDGPVTRAARQGAMLYLDEIAEAREDVIVALHPLTDHRREVYLDKLNETVKADANFFLVASYNPGYQRGVKELKPSTRQRFVTISLNYLPEAKEAQIICELTKVDPGVAKKIVQAANKIRISENLHLSEIVSTRLLVYAADLIARGMDQRMACRYSIAETLTDDKETQEALVDLINLIV